MKRAGRKEHLEKIGEQKGRHGLLQALRKRGVRGPPGGAWAVLDRVRSLLSVVMTPQLVYRELGLRLQQKLDFSGALTLVSQVSMSVADAEVNRQIKHGKKKDELVHEFDCYHDNILQMSWINV